ncbi:putative protein serine/threonine kinase [Tieghemostelium lacteum]|uniref:dual-specificity kinase n=1 Tax=Tieghemostelium lacteum TaxID=361077 RepID=A0A151ZFH4_TIELA|nr:putative protein serine/threonine kinase [Tieghemostelium lacteum]|eukprot:KYQ92685.1 putative protein serine/threonine kinase [Tieghemostelium lacteum]
MIETHNPNNDIKNLKTTLSARAMARRSVSLNASAITQALANGGLDDSTTNISPKKSKEEPIKLQNFTPPKPNPTSTSTTTTTTTSSNGNGSSQDNSGTNSTTTKTTTKKVPDRPSINPSVRKTKEPLANGASTGNSPSLSSSTSISTFTPKKPTSSSTTTSTKTTDDKPPLSNSSSIKKPTSSSTTTNSSTPSSSSSKSRSVSISIGNKQQQPNSSTPTTIPTNTNTTTSTEETTKAPVKSTIDDVFARLSSITKPVIKSRSQSVSVNLSASLNPNSLSGSSSNSSNSSTPSNTSKFTKILSKSKTLKPDERRSTLQSLSSTTTTSTLSSNRKSPLSKSSTTSNNNNTTSSTITTTTTTTTTTTSISTSLTKSSSPNTNSNSNSNSSSNSTSSNPLSSYKCTVMTPATAKKIYGNDLTEHEKEEILTYSQIYFTGTTTCKVKFNSSLPNDGFDNEEGEYKIIEHDHIAYRYEVLSILGQGSFCQVAKAYDHKNQILVALKIIRNQKRFYTQAQTEIKILEYLKENDKNSTANIVHLDDHFNFRNHLVLSFELLSLNLFDFLKANNFQGFNLDLVRRFAAQILTSLKFLYKRNVIHADLKPENILLKQPTKSGIKLIDFGSSCFENEQIFTYIQSRFYRSPEVILGLRYDKSIDIWSLGCILAELYTGIPIFPGCDEVEQLALIMEVIGQPPLSIIEDASRRDIYFEKDGTPKLVINKQTGQHYGIASKSFRECINSDDADFIDFITHCLKWDPEKRINPEQGLKHRFLAPLTSLSPPSSSTSTTHS